MAGFPGPFTSGGHVECEPVLRAGRERYTGASALAANQSRSNGGAVLVIASNRVAIEARSEDLAPGGDITVDSVASGLG